MNKATETALAEPFDDQTATAPERFAAMTADGSITAVYQPIHSLHRDQTVGFEALARFHTDPYRSPDHWFREADKSGCRLELELHAITIALQGLPALPRDAFLSVNASPSTITSGRLVGTLSGFPTERMVLEVTEQEPIASYEEFADALRPLRAAGTQLAVDDVGAGNAGLMHIAHLNPDIIKLDRTVTAHIGSNRHIRALTAAITGFATEIGCAVLAEGIENDEQLTMMTTLGASLGQGYLLGRPEPIAQQEEA
ncbi:MAG TPA: EAL domain-containing protein [Solirubrobacteraceae bacterium]|jgi:EAL domain-containing protein (putative c-di-GMP-specific phosphodiesterase class I)|nr:EAL domain-containing protein [Solirubrobacteraceae bacterium]